MKHFPLLTFLAALVFLMAALLVPESEDKNFYPLQNKVVSEEDLAEYEGEVVVGEIVRLKSLMFGPIEIDLENGNVVIPEGITTNEASREFWRMVIEAFPDIKRDICDQEKL